LEIHNLHLPLSPYCTHTLTIQTIEKDVGGRNKIVLE